MYPLKPLLKKACHFLMGLLLCLPMTALSATEKHPPHVVVTLKPIYGLTSQIMSGVAKPTLLLPDYTSPHTFQLRPSQHQALQAADLIIWMDPELENFMQKPIENIKPQYGILTLGLLPTLKRYHQRSGKDWEHHCAACDHDHHHDHENFDPHYWLSPENAMVMAKAIAGKLEQIDPEHAIQYEANVNHLIERLEKLDTEIKNQLTPLQQSPFLVYHDGYQYFEKAYGLNGKGTLVVNPHVPLSAKRLHELHHLIKEKHIQCVLTETEFQDSKVAKIVNNPNVKVVELDPLGAKVPADNLAYDNIMKALADGFEACLAQDNEPVQKVSPQ